LLELSKFRGLSLREASALSGQSVALLKVNVHRAIRRMRQAWESHCAHDPAACPD
jgi:DNA-directed RNA polymerase specialized sigma24 family protein